MPKQTEHQILAVVFDLDDTLYAERDYVRSGYRAVAGNLRATLGPRRLTRDGVEAGQWLWDRFSRGRADGAFDALNEAFELGLGGDDIRRLVEVYRSHRPDIRPVDGAADTLDRLKGQYRLGLLSDGFLPAQRLKLDALRLGDFFDAVVFTEDLGRECWKPSPAGFETIAGALGVSHDACAYVGDNPSKDFVAPNALGWLTVQLSRPGQVHAHKPAPADGEPRAVVRSWDDLLSVVRGPCGPRAGH